MTNALSIFQQLKPVTIGFDDIFEDFGRMFDNNILRHGYTSNYPPYDIKKIEENRYDIQVALAGYSKKDIIVEVKENILSIKSVKSEEQTDEEVIHQGISKRYFERQFTIAEDVKVKDAQLKDGLLTVSLLRVVPEEKLPRTIKIQ